MAYCVLATQAWQPEFESQNSCKGKWRELASRALSSDHDVCTVSHPTPPPKVTNIISSF